MSGKSLHVYIIDNYDSFTYNLYQYVGEVLSHEKSVGHIDDFAITVKRNNEVTLDDIVAARPDRIIISPGPGSPDDEAYFGVSAKVIRELGQATPLLGVCLGMQGIVHVFGGKVVQAPLPMHGKISPISHSGSGLFKGIPDQLEVMRYHSLVAEPGSVPDCLQVTATVGGDSGGTQDGTQGGIQKDGEAFEIMAVEHKEFPIQGIQFHPESFATEGGKELIRNFLRQDERAK